MLLYPAALPLSRQTLDYTAGIIRRQIGSPWRKLNPGRQALLVLAYLPQGRDVRRTGRPVRHRHRHRLEETSPRPQRCWPPGPPSCAGPWPRPRTPGTPTWSSTGP